MIFVTTGTSKLPFERFVREVDRLAGAGVFGEDRVLMQYRGSDFQPAHCERVDALDFGEMLQAVEDARLVLGHGGAGTLLLCREAGVPMILVARRAEFGENHDDHQVDFCEHVAAHQLAYYAAEMEDLESLCQDALRGARPQVDAQPCSQLVATLRDFASSCQPAEAQG